MVHPAFQRSSVPMMGTLSGSVCPSVHAGRTSCQVNALAQVAQRPDGRVQVPLMVALKGPGPMVVVDGQVPVRRAPVGQHLFVLGQVRGAVEGLGVEGGARPTSSPVINGSS